MSIINERNTNFSHQVVNNVGEADRPLDGERPIQDRLAADWNGRKLSVVCETSKLIWNYIKSITNLFVQTIYETVHPDRDDFISDTNLLTNFQIDRYRTTFNEENPNVHFMNCQSLWTRLPRERNQNEMVPLQNNEFNRGEDLEYIFTTELAAVDKRYIAMPLNRDNSHWMVAVVDRQERTIRLYDSGGMSSASKAVHLGQRLNEAKVACERIFGGEYTIWTKDVPNGRGGAFYSVLGSGHQCDGWNCGCYMFEYAHLIGQGWSDEEINNRSFVGMQRAIAARRQAVRMANEAPFEDLAYLQQIA